MTEIVIDTTRAARYGVTRKKHITITLDSHDHIDEWAASQGLTFSAAIEALAIIGLGSDATTSLTVLTTGLLERIVGKQFNRFARLISQAAIASEAANWKLDALLLNLIRQEALEDPVNFVGNMAVSTDPADAVAVTIRRLRDDMKAMAHETAVNKLRKKIDEAELLLSSMTREDEDE